MVNVRHILAVHRADMERGRTSLAGEGGGTALTILSLVVIQLPLKQDS
jgi:hypothetical protein